MMMTRMRSRTTCHNYTEEIEGHVVATQMLSEKCSEEVRVCAGEEKADEDGAQAGSSDSDQNLESDRPA